MDSRFHEIKALYFDAGSTLIEEVLCYKKRIADTIALNPGAPSEAVFLSLFQEAAEQRQNPYRYSCAKLGLQKQAPWDFSCEALFPGILPLLAELQRHYLLAIVANQPAGFQKRTDRLGLTPYFACIIGSDDVGLEKPDPRIFKLAEARLAIPFAQSVMIGDRLENDITPAKKLGMQTIWVRQGFAHFQEPRGANEIPTAVIETLMELHDLLL
jgi:HAD superfamily hydrolase (TIGR01549 family)